MTWDAAGLVVQCPVSRGCLFNLHPLRAWPFASYSAVWQLSDLRDRRYQEPHQSRPSYLRDKLPDAHPPTRASQLSRRRRRQGFCLAKGYAHRFQRLSDRTQRTRPLCKVEAGSQEGQRSGSCPGRALQYRRLSRRLSSQCPARPCQCHHDGHMERGAARLPRATIHTDGEGPSGGSQQSDQGTLAFLNQHSSSSQSYAQ